jgi:hypothetical protein
MARLAFALFLSLLLATAPARADPFVAGTEDVPLMQGLVPVEAGAVVFDKPEGRIIEAQARGKLERGAVRDFYRSTLPQLGWKALGVNAWRREAEMLRLEIGGRDGDVTVGFTLSPYKEPHIQ